MTALNNYTVAPAKARNIWYVLLRTVLDERASAAAIFLAAKPARPAQPRLTVARATSVAAIRTESIACCFLLSAKRHPEALQFGGETENGKQDRQEEKAAPDIGPGLSKIGFRQMSK
ncbi:hypothetical protein LPU83_3182 [Rhizobium favelukesii]|uniref:Uncharacterized protein n=1 Tax=Rhizobium favelukesii TaxID=348824 RepID=W6RC26_9HYPH|nr:hypothetical protein LPU83_3182 [Rhizobium favelukesii]